jgi:hypothetical protein
MPSDLTDEQIEHDMANFSDRLDQWNRNDLQPGYLATCLRQAFSIIRQL